MDDSQSQIANNTIFIFVYANNYISRPNLLTVLRDVYLSENTSVQHILPVFKPASFAFD